MIHKIEINISLDLIITFVISMAGNVLQDADKLAYNTKECTINIG